MSLQGSKKPKQQTESALPGPAGYEPAGLIFLTIGQAAWNGAGYATRNAVAPVKTITAVRLALHGDGRQTVSLDKVSKP